METKENQYSSRNFASEIGELTFRLLVGCQEKEERLSNQFKISVSEFRALRMFRGENTLEIKSLIKSTGLSGSRLTRILDGLEEKGLIIRTINADDRRSILVNLTEKGKAIAQQVNTRFIEIHQEILKDVPIEMHEPMMISFRRMLSSIERWIKES